MREAWGTFLSKGDHTFRTSAYIQWGKSEKPLGMFLMLNPGAASLKNSNLPLSAELVNGLLRIDKTMEQLIKIVHECNSSINKNLDGRLYIYNLFPLQNPSKNGALTKLRVLWGKEPLVREFPEDRSRLLELVKCCPWAVIAWGCNDRSDELDSLKTMWMNLLKEADIPVLGVQGKTKWDYLHPLPRIYEKVGEYRQELKSQFNNLFLNQAPKKRDNTSQETVGDTFDFKDSVKAKQENVQKNIRSELKLTTNVEKNGFKEYLRSLGLSESSVKDDMSRINVMASRGIDYTQGAEQARILLSQTDLSISTQKSCVRLCQRYDAFAGNSIKNRQNDQNTNCTMPKEEKLIDFMNNYLAEEGFRPKALDEIILAFNYEGRTFFINVYEDDDEFVQIYHPAFWPIESPEEKTVVQAAINAVNSSVKAVKLFILNHKSEEEVWATIEIISHDVRKSFPEIFFRCIETLDAAVTQFKRDMKNRRS